MDCSYCKKQVDLAFLMEEHVSGVGPERRRTCFQCLSEMGDKKMREIRAAKEIEQGLKPVRVVGQGGERRPCCSLPSDHSGSCI